MKKKIKAPRATGTTNKFGGDTGVDADFDFQDEAWDGIFGGDTGIDADFNPLGENYDYDKDDEDEEDDEDN